MEAVKNKTPESENVPRLPEHDELIKAWEQGTNPWSDELFRRMNVDESKVTAYTLPVLPDTRAAWEAAHPEILQQFKDCMYGEIPPAPNRIRTELLTEKTDALGGLATRREIRIFCEMRNHKSFDFDMLLYVPKQCAVPPPVFVGLNFNGNQVTTPETDVLLTRAPGCLARRWHYTGAPVVERGSKAERWNFAEAMRRGYAVATACYGEIFPDNPDGFRKSIFTLFYDNADLRPTYEIPLAELHGRQRNFGAISAWAWGMSRMLDVLECEPLVDASKATVIGHSRLGKAALWAGANDPRFNLVISNNSGCGGAALSRRNFGETLTMLWHIRSNWFCDRMMYFAGLEETLPIDQHQLLALIAPRALYVASSSEDIVADPKGEFLSAYHASEVWKLYGLPGLDVSEPPLVDTTIGGMVRYHVKTGNHSITAYDWQQYYDFADKVFGTKTTA